MMWDERYSIKEYAYGTEANGFLKEHYHRIPKGNVLCLAEGEGRNAVFLAKQGYKVTAVDASKVGLAKAQALAEKNKVTIKTIIADLANFEIENDYWQGIVSIFCHVPPAIRSVLHKKVVAGLQQNGTLLLEAYIPEQLKHGTGGPPVAEMMMSKKIVANDLDGLNFSLLEEKERQINEGIFHHGLGAVVQAVANKT